MKFNISSAMEYRMSFIIQTIGMALNNSAFIFFWWILFNTVENIGGYGFEDVMRIWALASTSFGIANIFFGNTRFITQIIMTGELDTYLLQPKDPVINMICGKTSLSSWGDAIYGLLLIMIVERFLLSKIVLFLILSTTGALLLTAVMVTLHSLSFYAGNMEAFAGLMVEFMITFSIYPEGIFGGALKWVLYTIVPVAFLAYIPRAIIMSLNLSLIPLVMIVVILWVIIAYTVFYHGLKRYESGNLIVNRL
jgi:ABC-2 type transport system permease protein